MERKSENIEQEIESTRARLKEAEATLRAIHKGTVDALVIAGSEGEEIHGILRMGTLADSLFNLMGNPVFIVDSENRILRANDAAQEIWGRNADLVPFNKAIQMKSMDGKPSGENAAIYGLPDGWIEAGEALMGLDMAVVRPDGETRYYQLDAKPAVLPLDGFVGGLVSLTDITNRKRAEIQSAVRSEQLRYQLQTTKSITDNLNEALILMDLENRIVFHNPAALRLLKPQDGGLAGKILYDVVSFEPDPEDPLHATWSAPAHLAIREMSMFRALLVDSTGRRVAVSCSHSMVVDEGTVRGGVLVLGDISAQITAEKALLQSIEKQRQSQKMEAIGRLAGGIAHDFNNLLLTILGFTDLSAAMVEDPRVLEHLGEIKRAGERAAILTSQLLAYSRKQILAPKDQSLNDVVDDARNMLARLIGENLRIELDLSGENLHARIDEAKLKQVMVNIALNARDAMPKGGILTIRTRKCVLSNRDLTGIVGTLRREGEEGPPAAEYGSIEMADTGHGMDSGVIDRLFEPFFTTKEFGRGSGLGLSTAFGIVRQMGGYIQVFSEEGRGSMFRILLPLSAGAEPIDSGKTGKQLLRKNLGAGKTVLLVEDEDMVRTLLKGILSQSGYQVIEAGNGEEALEKLGSADVHPDLVVTDVVMERMGGIELAARLRKLDPDSRILFISGYAADADELPRSSSGELCFLAKPFLADEFLNKVNAMSGMLENPPE